MNSSIFLPECACDTPPEVTPAGVITAPVLEVSGEAIVQDTAFADEIAANMIADFKKPGDKMVHVSSYTLIDGVYYMTYYANPHTDEEKPQYHTARLAYCRADAPEDMAWIDLQAAGDSYQGRHVDAVYDTILMQLDNEMLYLMWTACLDGDYYRLYRTYEIKSGELGPVLVNRLRVKGTLVDFSFSGIQRAFANEDVPIKNMYSDIGIMQKLTSRVEDGTTYYYTGAYSGDLNFIIKSRDLVTWEYVSQPDFPNESKWENATYVIGDKCWYFVRQEYVSPYGFLTCYDLEKDEWAAPVLVPDCQSRSDFIEFNGGLYLFHAPVDREHLGVVLIDQDDMTKSQIILQAKMRESCFYPFIQYCDGKLHLSYTSDRKHIWLSQFAAEKYLF